MDSKAVQPKMRSAAGFQVDMDPSGSKERIAKGDVWMMARNFPPVSHRRFSASCLSVTSRIFPTVAMSCPLEP